MRSSRRRGSTRAAWRWSRPGRSPISLRAIAAAIDPTLIVTEAVAVDVEIAGELTSGMTVADWRGVWKRGSIVEFRSVAEARAFEVWADISSVTAAA
jgi:hypothetical protein